MRGLYSPRSKEKGPSSAAVLVMLEEAMCRCQINMLFMLAQKIMAWAFLLLHKDKADFCKCYGKVILINGGKAGRRNVSSWMMSLHDRERVKVVSYNGK